MPPLPVLSAREIVAVFERFGWRTARSGNHVVMTREGSNVTLSIPNHREVARGTLRSLIRSANLSVEEFVSALSE
ncbi:MAG: type II toxin-antitoxin system HicA family toxin [Longimicrobiales bacterium]